MPYQLVVIKGRSNSQTLKVSPEGVTTVGRQDGCQIRISSSQVSRKHCEIFEKKGLLLVKDLGSSNGTFVNGKKIDGQQVLEPGNMLTVGAITFRIERTDVPGSAPAAPARKPSDTAVAEAVGVDDSGGEDDLEIDFEVEDETLHDSAPEADELATRAPAASPASRPTDDEDLIEIEEEDEAPATSASTPAEAAPATEPEPEPEPAEEETPEIGEDAVAEYLLNIDLDDEDKL
ncbi:MAG TPA: FHA domain-containing protein [Isosphaeraceae bacterium]|nr:FHA domain-containing protein [Isosphaeraceae bacterium]